MGKKDQKQAQSDIKGNISQLQQEGTALDTQLQGILSGAEKRGESLFPKVAAGYSDISTTGGYDPGVTGGIVSGYEDLAKTGGISEDQARAIRDRSTQAATGVISTISDEAKRIAASTGGYGGTGAVEAMLSRRGAEAGAEASLQAEGDIAALRTRGREAGLYGLSGLEGDIARNRISGVAGLGRLYGANIQQAQDTVNQIINRYRVTGQLTEGDLAMLTDLSKRPGVFQSILNAIGTVGGAAAGVVGAIPSGGSQVQQPTTGPSYGQYS